MTVLSSLAPGGVTARRSLRRRLLLVAMTIFATILLHSLFFALTLNEEVTAQVLTVMLEKEETPTANYKGEQFIYLGPSDRNYQVCWS